MNRESRNYREHSVRKTEEGPSEMNNENRQLTRQPEYDFLRVVSAFGIILYHFSLRVGDGKNAFTFFANGDFGTSFVFVFFLLSGGLLYRKYHESLSLKDFYRKRFRSIFPSFWIAFLFFFLSSVLREGRFFYQEGASKTSLLLSVVGMDGYLLYRIPNYYILGEWFLGAMILLYLFFPLFLKGMKKCPWALLPVFAFGILLSVLTGFFRIPIPRNLFTVSFVFCLGMLLFRYPVIFENRAIPWIMLPVCIFLYFVEIPGPFSVFFQIIFSFGLFVILISLGRILMKAGFLRRFFVFFSGISFQMFLLQSEVIGRITAKYPEVTVLTFPIRYLYILCVTAGAAYLLKKITDAILRLKISGAHGKKNTVSDY